MLILGMQGMPRRYYDYLPQYETGNFLAGFGGYLLIIGMVTMFVNLLLSFKQRLPAPVDPWGGTTLEWTVPSPPPVYNFMNKPHVEDYPYDFSKVNERFQETGK
jgi:cytochrome c oxidase subunit 1